MTMEKQQSPHGCVHSFSYLTKKFEDGKYISRVLEIPAIIISGDTMDKLEDEIKIATLDYLHTFDDTHQKSLNDELKPILVSPKRGVVVELKPFKVIC